MKKNIIISIIGFMAFLIIGSSNVYGSEYSFTATNENSSYSTLDFSAAERHQELVGIYYTSHVNYLDDPIISKLVQKQDTSIGYNELKTLIKDGKVYVNTNGGMENLEAMYRRSLETKKDMQAKGNGG